MRTIKTDCAMLIKNTGYTTQCVIVDLKPHALKSGESMRVDQGNSLVFNGLLCELREEVRCEDYQS